MEDAYTATAQEVSDCMDAIKDALAEVKDQFGVDAFEIALRIKEEYENDAKNNIDS